MAARVVEACQQLGPSMKVPPKRKGNPVSWGQSSDGVATLNESPSEKEGKSQRRLRNRR